MCGSDSEGVNVYEGFPPYIGGNKSVLAGSVVV